MINPWPKPADKAPLRLNFGIAVCCVGLAGAAVACLYLVYLGLSRVAWALGVLVS